MRRPPAADFTRRFPTIAIAVVAFATVSAALLGNGEKPYIFPFAETGEQIGRASGLVADGAGNLYVADVSNHRIWRIDPEGTITPVAGTGEEGFSGDSGPATEAQFNIPTQLALDEEGNLYVADVLNQRIRRIDPEGVITTIAGTGEEGFSGDGGPATEAQFNFPSALALDATDNLYVSDSGNRRLRRIDPEGVITTIAGTGERGFSGDGGPATEAQFSGFNDLAVDDSGNVYVVDSNNNRIRRIDPEGIVTTIAGTGERGFIGDGGPAMEAQFYWPNSVLVDGAGNIYVADWNNCRIRRIDPEGIVTTFAGSGPAGTGCGFGGDGGPATEAQLKRPHLLALDGAGNVYVSENSGRRIRIIRLPGERNPVTQEFPQFANGDSTVSDLVLVNVDTKTVTSVVRFYDSMGNPISADAVVDVSEDLELAEDGALSVKAGIPPLGERTISTHGRGALTNGSVRVVSDGYTGGVLRFDNMAVGVAGVGAAQRVNDAIFPARRQEGGINTGAAIRNLASESMALTCHLMHGGEVRETAMVELAGNGQQARFINELFPEADTSDFTGSVRCTAPEGKEFTGVALELDARNRVFTTLPVVAVPDTSRGDIEVPRIFPIAGTGEVGYGGDGGPATDARLLHPISPAVDGEGNVYVVDRSNHRIRRIDPEGIITTIAGTGENEYSFGGGYGGDGGPATEARLSFPNAVLLDEEGNLYVTDGVNSRIRRIDPEGIITTIAGTGERGFGGDGGPATEAQLNRPHTMVLDGAGNLYVTDRDDFRIRRIDPEGVITTFAGTGERGFAGDGGPATEAQFRDLYGLALDATGNLYVADRWNYRIRRIDPDGIISTFAGTGEWGSAGDGGPAAEAQLAAPYAVAVDKAGHVYVGGSGCGVRRIDPEGTITTVAGMGPEGCSDSGDGGPATEARLSNEAHGLALDGAGNLYVADRGNHRIRVVRPAGERNPVTHEFPQFANGDSTASDLVLVNVDTKTVIPVVRFYDSMGNPISADSLVEVTEDLQLAENGALTVTAGVPPLGERTISTHGQGALTTGSVRVVSDGYTGGVLRFESMAVGVAGVGAAEPVNHALFPARRQEGGINTGAAIRNLASEAMTITCHLMQGGEVLETAMVELAGNGQQARFINEMFPDADTSDFTGSVRCTAPEGKRFAGVALEMDIQHRIFTTLPLVPVGR